MCFSVIPSDKFKKEARHLSKKYLSLKEELAELNDTLASKPETGTALGNDIYKSDLLLRIKGKERAADELSPMW